MIDPFQYTRLFQFMNHLRRRVSMQIFSSGLRASLWNVY
jgi:hypothetical protein